MRTLQEAAKIDGWMTPIELSWLRAVALSLPPGAKFYELGCLRGRATVALAVDHVYLTCVDSFEGAPGDFTEQLAAKEDLYATFTGNMRRLGLRPRLLRMSALEAATLVPDGSLDAVFDDSDHDLLFEAHFWAWLPKLKKEGRFCGHDFLPEFPEIPRVLAASGLRFWVVPGTSIWFLFKP